MKKLLFFITCLLCFQNAYGLNLNEQIKVLASIKDTIPTYLFLGDTIINIKNETNRFDYQKMKKRFTTKKGIGAHYENGYITIRYYEGVSQKFLLSLYIHERQHYLNQNTYSWYKYFKCISKDELWMLIGKFCSNPGYYKSQGHYSMADEFIAFAVEDAYRRNIDIIECCKLHGINDERVIKALSYIPKT